MVGQPRIRIHFFLVLSLLSASGCQVARMELDPALANVGAMSVKGNSGLMWNRHLQFGAWQTSTVKEGWTQDVGLEAAQGEAVAASDKLSKKYRFDMSTTSGPIEAKCEQLGGVATLTRSHGDSQTITEVDIAALRKRPPLKCTYDGVGGGTLKLLKQYRSPPTHDGEVEFAGQLWRVDEVFRIAGARAWSIAPLSGFEIRRDGTVIAAVEVINGGRVWFAPSLSQLDQDRAAAIVTTLLLFQPLEPSPASV